jgi:hypothetical protein
MLVQVCLALERPRKKDCQFEASLGYIATPCLKKIGRIENILNGPSTLQNDSNYCKKKHVLEQTNTGG